MARSKPDHSTPSGKRETKLEASLGRMQFDGPDPSLRHRTMEEVGKVLDSDSPSDSQQPGLSLGQRSLWRPAWAAAALLVLIWQLPTGLMSPSSNQTPAAESAAVAALWLDLDEDLARHVGARLAGVPTNRSIRSLSTQPKIKGSLSHDRYSLDYTNL